LLIVTCDELLQKIEMLIGLLVRAVEVNRQRNGGIASQAPEAFAKETLLL
jgi:hypothetical protein